MLSRRGRSAGNPDPGNTTIAVQHKIRSCGWQTAKQELLGSRLIACAEVLPAIEHCSAGEILGDTDALKLKSSMTLFDNASPEEDTVIAQVLVRFFRGRRCLFTMEKTGDGYQS